MVGPAQPDLAYTLHASTLLTCLTCGALLTEDRQFWLDASRADMTIRRYGCQNGHSLYTGVEDREATWQPARNQTGKQRKSCRPRSYE